MPPKGEGQTAGKGRRPPSGIPAPTNGSLAAVAPSNIVKKCHQHLLTMKTFTSSPPYLSSRISGFALLEVLVTMLVISFGLLGIASMQLSVKRASYQTSQRALAYTLAGDLMERIRVNGDGVSGYQTASALTGSAIANEPTCESATCTSAEIANRDLFAWERLIDSGSVQINSANAGGLIAPAGCVVFTPSPTMPAGTNTGEVRVVVSWLGLDEVQSAASARTYYTTTNPGTACGFVPADASDADMARRQHVILTSYFTAPQDLLR